MGLGLDLAGLHAHAVDLQLPIQAPDDLQSSLPEAAQIAGAVDSAEVLLALDKMASGRHEQASGRVHNALCVNSVRRYELRGREFRTLPVARCQHASEADLASFPGGISSKLPSAMMNLSSRSVKETRNERSREKESVRPPSPKPTQNYRPQGTKDEVTLCLLPSLSVQRSTLT